MNKRIGLALLFVGVVFSYPVFAFELVGSVVDLEGKPVAAAEVVVSWNEFDRRKFSDKPQRTKSNEKGEFRLTLKDQSENGLSGSHKGDLGLIIYNNTHYAEAFIDPRDDRDSEKYLVHIVAVKRQDRCVRIVNEAGESLKDEAVLFVPSATANGSSTRQYFLRPGRTDKEGNLRYEYMEGEHILAVYAHCDDAWWNTSDEIAKWRLRGRAKNPDASKPAEVVLYDVGGTMDEPVPKGYSGRVYSFSTPIDIKIQTVAAFDGAGQCVFQDRIGNESGNYGRVVSWLNPKPGAAWDEKSDREKHKTRFTRVALPQDASRVLLTREDDKPTGRGSSRTITNGFAWVEIAKTGGQPQAIEFKELSELPCARMRMAEIERGPVKEHCSTSLEVLFNGANVDLYWAEADADGWFKIPIFPPAKAVSVQTWGGSASSKLPFNDLPALHDMVAGKDYTLYYHPTVKPKVRLVDSGGKELKGYWLSFGTTAADASRATGWLINSGADSTGKPMRAKAECELYYLNQRIKFIVPAEDNAELVIVIGAKK